MLPHRLLLYSSHAWRSYNGVTCVPSNSFFDPFALSSAIRMDNLPSFHSCSMSAKRFSWFPCSLPPVSRHPRAAQRHSPHSTGTAPLSKLFFPFVQFVGRILFPRALPAAPRRPAVWRAETASSAKPIYRAPRARFPVQINPPSTILSFHHSFLPSSPLVPRHPNLTTAARQSPKNLPPLQFGT